MRRRSRSRPIWLLLVAPILLTMLVPPVVAGQPATGSAVAQVTQQVLQHPVAESVPTLLPVAKALLITVAVLAVVGIRWSARLLIGYYAAMSIVTGLLQNAAEIPGQGLAFLTGNAVIQIALAIACLASLRGTAIAASPLRRARLWVVPLMLIAAAMPFEIVDGSPVAGLSGVVTNGAGVTFCMITSVVAGALFLRPSTYPPLLRVTVGSVGLVFGTWNLVTWFGLALQA